jgi:DNA-binding transcriptional MocR family regulator
MADAISFSRGAPSVDIVDIEGLRAAADRALTNDPAGTTAYGTAVGYVPLRKWIAEKHGVTPEHVIVTNGSMQADAFLFDELVSPGTQVVVEKPSYDRTLLGLKERGAEITAIPLENDGIDVAALRTALEGGLRPAFAHVIPNYQNPGGCSLSLEKRKELVALAEQYDFLIFEDDPYREIRFRGELLPAMYELAPERVVFACSFSKTVAPGVRTGYLVGAPELIAKIVRRATNTYIAPDMLAQSVVYELTQDADRFARSLQTVNDALRERSDLLGAAPAGGDVRAAGRRLLPLGRAARELRRRRGGREDGRLRRRVREGLGLRARRLGQVEPAPRLLGRSRRSGRRRRPAPRRLPERPQGVSARAARR